MKNLGILLLIISCIYAFSCKKEQVETVQESIPPDITYSILDSGRVVFKNTYPSTFKFNWAVRGLSSDKRAEGYDFESYDPFVVFLSNGKKHIEVIWKDSLGAEQSKKMELEISNAIAPKETSYMKASILGNSFIEEYYPLYFGRILSSNDFGYGHVGFMK